MRGRLGSGERLVKRPNSSASSRASPKDTAAIPNVASVPAVTAAYGIELSVVTSESSARATRPGESVIEGLYATGNCAENAFGTYCPGADATIGNG